MPRGTTRGARRLVGRTGRQTGRRAGSPARLVSRPSLACVPGARPLGSSGGGRRLPIPSPSPRPRPAPAASADSRFPFLSGVGVLPPRGKASSNKRSNNARSRSSFTSVAASASRNVVRSTPAAATAVERVHGLGDGDVDALPRAACRRRPTDATARRQRGRAATNDAILGSTRCRSSSCFRMSAERLAHGRCVQLPNAERAQAARPVERLGDAGRLGELELAQTGDEAGDLVPQPHVELRHLERDDLRLLLRPREVDEEVETAPQQRLGQVAGAIRREHDHRPVPRRHRSQLGNRHLEIAQHLEQEGLELGIGLVDLVDQQHHAAWRRQGAQQRPLEQIVGARRCRARRRPTAAPRRDPPGCAAAASGSSTRRAHVIRRGPRSTAGGGGRSAASRPGPCPARSCRLPPGLRQGAASPAEAPGTARSPRAAW